MALLRQSKLMILLSINAAAILIAGILIAGAIFFKDGLEFRVVSEKSDEVELSIEETELLDSAAELVNNTQIDADFVDYATSDDTGIEYSAVDDGELWNKTAMQIYETADVDICVNGTLDDLGDMFWQTSDTSVIAGFYNTSRKWLGYDESICRYPIITGTGTTTITVGTYDGTRKDSITVTVVEAPESEWKFEILKIVNTVRVKNGLNSLSWGSFCEDAASERAEELAISYSHTRPNGESWSTACPVSKTGQVVGENLAAGNGAVTPSTTMLLWLNSDAHRENILNPDFTKLAVGFYFDYDSEYKTYWSQYFSNF